MTSQYEFMSLRGSSHLARNINGKATVLRELGNQTAVDVSIESEKYHRYSTKTAKKEKVLTQTKTQGVNVEIKLDEQKREDVALALHSEMNTTQSESMTGEIGGDAANALKVGDEVKLDGFNISTVVITDSASAPKTLAENTDYQVDADYGTITILKLDNVVQPLNVTYMSGETQSTVLLSLPSDAEYYYLFKGVNSIDDKRLALELWRFSPEIDGSMGFINEETGEITIKGSALSDPKKGNDPKLGGFGRIVYLD